MARADDLGSHVTIHVDTTEIMHAIELLDVLAEKGRTAAAQIQLAIDKYGEADELARADGLYDDDGPVGDADGTFAADRPTA